MGQRPNEGYAEMSACLYLPDGRVGFFFERAATKENSLLAGGLSWQGVEPWRRNRVRYEGRMMLLAAASRPMVADQPQGAFTEAPRVAADIDLACCSSGLGTVMGRDQDHIDLIFLPGQADFHYQHLCRAEGSVVNGLGGKDHSWGPRNWHSKRSFRWLIAGIDADSGFMKTRAVGLTKRTRAGFLVDRGRFAISHGLRH